MTRPKDPNGLRGKTGPDRVDSEAAPSGRRQRFPSPEPPPSPQERTLGQLIAALTQCAHPDSSLSRATVQESDGSKVSIRWCALCGAVDVVGHGKGTWIRPGIAQVLRGSDRLTTFTVGIGSLAEKLKELTSAVQLERARLDGATATTGGGFPCTATALDNLCEELRQRVHVLLEEVCSSNPSGDG